MSGWRTALRVAWREARRSKGRSALVLGMITVPVAALAFTASSYDTFTLTPAEKADRLMGAAQAIATWPYDTPVQQRPDRLTPVTPTPSQRASGPTAERLLALLPAGSRAIPEVAGDLTVRTVSGIGTIGSLILDYTDPAAHGLVRQLSGRAPATADEAAITPATRQRTGADVGGTVTTADGGRTLHVVGVVERPDDLAAETVVLRPTGPPTGSVNWLLDTPTPITWDQVRRLNTHGITVVSRQVLANPPSSNELYPGTVQLDDGPSIPVLVLVAGLAMLEVVLLAGPAFAVGARRRQRDLALVAAAGGTPAHLRRIVLADGVVLGAIAAGLGLVLGIGVAAAVHPLLETFLSRHSGAFRLYPLAQLVVAGLAVVTGLLAALVPAWTAARQDVVAALRGRRGITRSRRRWVVVGLVLLGAGAGLAIVGAATDNLTVILAGVIAAEFGLVLCTPAIVGVAGRLGRWLPLAARVALRDTSRNRTAAAPAISAVMAVVIGTLAVSVVLKAQTAREAEASNGRPGDVYLFRYADRATFADRPIPADVITAMRAILPVTEVHEVSWPSCPDARCYVSVRTPPAQECPYSARLLGRQPDAVEQRAARNDPRCEGMDGLHNYFTGSLTGLGGTRVFTTDGALVAVVDDQAAGAVTELPAADAGAANAALRAGKIVVSDPRYLDGGRVTLAMSTSGVDRTVTGAGFALPHLPKAPIVLLTPATASSLGLTTIPLTTMATTSRMPTTDEQDRLQAAIGDEYDVRVNRGTDTNTQYLTILAIVAGVVTLAAAALATGLAATDRRADLGTLAAIGASPRVRRALSLWQSGVIAGLGSLLGAAAGLGTSIAVLSAFNTSYADQWPAPTPFPISVPWFNVVVALAVVPVIAMLGAGLLTRSRLPIERRL